MNLKKMILFTEFMLMYLTSIVSYADERKVHLFPIVPINTDIEICRQYSDILKDKLQMTEIFTLFEVQDFSFEPGQFKNIIFSLKDAVTKTCKNKNINSAIYGTIEKKNSLLCILIRKYHAPS